MNTLPATPWFQRFPPPANRFWRSFVLLLVLLLLVGLSACAQRQPVSEDVLPGTSQTPGVMIQDVDIERFAELIVGILIVSAVVSLITQRLKIPYTIGLVVAGLAVSIFGQQLVQPLRPEIILIILLPPLLFEAVERVDFQELRRAIAPILILAVPGVILTTLLVGGVLALGASLPLPFALVFGALIAPTDPVSVLALFRTIGAPKRLLAIFEGESLLNDGTSIVLFKLMLVIALTGEVNVQKAFLQFLLIAGGGILVGISIGVLFAFILNRINQHIVETTLTIILAYGSYLVGELFFGVSGVLSVVAAGLTVNYLSRSRLSPTSHIFVTDFWEYVAFIANSVIFLMIGVQTKVSMLVQNTAWIVWSILAVIIARALVVLALYFLRGMPVPFSWSIILFWGGLRGAVSLALALSLSYAVDYREQIQAMTFGVVLFSLIVQGSTISNLVKQFGLVQPNQSRLQYERWQAQVATLRAAVRHLDALKDRGLVPPRTAEALLPIINARIDRFTQEESALLDADPSFRQEAVADIWRDILRTRRSTLLYLYQNNIISEQVYNQMVAEIDAMIADEHQNWPEIQALLNAEPKE